MSHEEKDCPLCKEGIPLKEFVRIPYWKESKDPLKDPPDGTWDISKDKYDQLIKRAEVVKVHEPEPLPCAPVGKHIVSKCISVSKPVWGLGKIFVCPFCSSRWEGMDGGGRGNMWRVMDL